MSPSSALNLLVVPVRNSNVSALGSVFLAYGSATGIKTVQMAVMKPLTCATRRHAKLANNFSVTTPDNVFRRVGNAMAISIVGKGIQAMNMQVGH